MDSFKIVQFFTFTQRFWCPIFRYFHKKVAQIFSVNDDNLRERKENIDHGIVWVTWKGRFTNFQKTEMWIK